MENTLWGHLPLLVNTNSKESVEYILQVLWRTRKTGLDSTDRLVIAEMLQLTNHSDLDPVLIDFVFSFPFLSVALIVFASRKVKSPFFC